MPSHIVIIVCLTLGRLRLKTSMLHFTCQAELKLSLNIHQNFNKNTNTPFCCLRASAKIEKYTNGSDWRGKAPTQNLPLPKSNLQPRRRDLMASHRLLTAFWTAKQTMKVPPCIPCARKSHFVVMFCREHHYSMKRVMDWNTTTVLGGQAHMRVREKRGPLGLPARMNRQKHGRGRNCGEFKRIITSAVCFMLLWPDFLLTSKLWFMGDISPPKTRNSKQKSKQTSSKWTEKERIIF